MHCFIPTLSILQHVSTHHKCHHQGIFVPGADKSLARTGRKQALKHVRDARDFNIETRAVIKFFFSARQGAEGNSRHSDRGISLFHPWSG